MVNKLFLLVMCFTYMVHSPIFGLNASLFTWPYLSRKNCIFLCKSPGQVSDLTFTAFHPLLPTSVQLHTTLSCGLSEVNLCFAWLFCVNHPNLRIIFCHLSINFSPSKLSFYASTVVYFLNINYISKYTYQENYTDFIRKWSLKKKIKNNMLPFSTNILVWPSVFHPFSSYFFSRELWDVTLQTLCEVFQT